MDRTERLNDNDFFLDSKANIELNNLLASNHKFNNVTSILKHVDKVLMFSKPTNSTLHIYFLCFFRYNQIISPPPLPF